MIDLMVIKATRACNLTCPYCYYINEHTPNYGAVITAETVEAVYGALLRLSAPGDALRLRCGTAESHCSWDARDFKTFPDSYNAPIFTSDQVHNVLQSNGALITQDWIDFFKQNHV